MPLGCDSTCSSAQWWCMRSMCIRSAIRHVVIVLVLSLKQTDYWLLSSWCALGGDLKILSGGRVGGSGHCRSSALPRYERRRRNLVGLPRAADLDERLQTAAAFALDCLAMPSPQRVSWLSVPPTQSTLLAWIRTRLFCRSRSRRRGQVVPRQA